MNLIERRTTTLPALRFLEAPRAGSTLLLVHGVCRRAEDFDMLWEKLLPQTNVVAIDQRGHGDSERASRYLVTDYVTDAIRFLQNRAEPAFIMGHSLGAMVAAAVAAELPELVRGIVLEDPPFHTMGRNIHGSAWQAQFVGMRDAALMARSVEQLIDMLAEVRLPQPDGGVKRMGDIRDRPNLLWSAQCLAKLDPQVLTSIIEGSWLEGYDIPDVFRAIRCPALLLQADPRAGGAMAHTDARLCEDAIAKCRIIRFPKAGHLLHRQQPAVIAGLVNELVS